MTEEQKAKYEEAAELQIKNVPSIHSNLKLVEKLRFIEGTEHAHPIGFNLGKEEGKKEGWNEAVGKFIDFLSYSVEVDSETTAKLIQKIVKLRK